MPIDLADIERRINEGIYGDDRMTNADFDDAFSALAALLAELETAAHKERQNVVAWLRREASAMHPAEPDRAMLSYWERNLLLVFAACIERGEHLREVE